MVFTRVSRDVVRESIESYRWERVNKDEDGAECPRDIAEMQEAMGWLLWIAAIDRPDYLRHRENAHH
jgi:hypothetical protein